MSVTTPLSGVPWNGGIDDRTAAIDANNPDGASEGGGAVDSVNGQTGVVVLDAGDVDAASTADLATEVSHLVTKVPDFEDALDVDKSASDQVFVSWLDNTLTVGDTSQVVIEVESAFSVADAIAHGGYILLVGYDPDEPFNPPDFPLYGDQVNEYKTNVTAYKIGKVEGQATAGAGSVLSRISLDNLTPTNTLKLSLLPNVIGYSNTETMPFLANPLDLVAHVAQELAFACTGNAVIPILLGRRHENYRDIYLDAINMTNATQMAFIPDGSKLWVSDWFGLALKEIDITTMQVSRSISITGGPTAIAIASATVGYYYDGTTLRVGEFNPSTGATTNTNRYQNDAGSFTQKLSLSPDGTKLAYIVDKGSGNFILRVLNTSTWAATVDVDTGIARNAANLPRIAWEPTSTALWITFVSADTVRRYVIGTGFDTARAFTFQDPTGIAVSPDGTMLTVVGSSAGASDDNWAYYMLPPAAGAAPVRFDGTSAIAPIHSVALTSASWFYLAGATSLITIFGGTMHCRPQTAVNSEWLKLRVWGAS